MCADAVSLLLLWEWTPRSALSYMPHALIDEAKSELQDIVHFLGSPDDHSRLGGKVRHRSGGGDSCSRAALRLQYCTSFCLSIDVCNARCPRAYCLWGLLVQAKPCWRKLWPAKQVLWQTRVLHVTISAVAMPTAAFSCCLFDCSVVFTPPLHVLPEVPFFNVSGSQFEEMFVGVGASRVSTH